MFKFVIFNHLIFLIGPLLAFWLVFRLKNKIGKLLSLLMALILGVSGYLFYGSHMMVCWYSVTSPEYSTTFSSKSSSGEVNFKGMTYSDVLSYLEAFQAENNVKELQLCRMCERDKLTWLNYYAWYDLLTHPRWELPFCEKGVENSTQ